MHTPFPRRRLHGTALATALAIALPVGWPSPVTADDLDHRNHAVEHKIDRAGQQLDQSSAELTAAARALSAAETALATARKTLTETQSQLEAANTIDAQMQARLAVAEGALERARSDVANTRTRIREQEDDLRKVAVSTYQNGDPNLLALSMVLTSNDPADLSGQLNSVKSVMSKESATLDRLDATKALLLVRERERLTARWELARQRSDAADNLARRHALETEAQSAESDIQDLVQKREEQRQVAAQAKATDQQALRDLQRERERVSTMLRRRAEQARKRAAAAARAGRPPQVGGSLMWPVNGWISSPFGMRLHPVFKRWSLHDGLDIASACGTPVRAASSGQVVARYFNSAYGNRIILDNGFERGVGVATTYNHMSGFSAFVGQRVQRGDVIGYVGTTGASTGCHLHFMVVENGQPTDPMSWL